MFLSLHSLEGFSGILWDSLGFSGILWDSLGLCGMLGDSHFRVRRLEALGLAFTGVKWRIEALRNITSISQRCSCESARGNSARNQ